KFNKYIVSLFVAGIFFSACNKDFLDKKPDSQLSSSTYWTTADNAEKAVNATYRYLRGDDWWKPFLSCATDDSYAWSNWPCDIMFAGNGSATPTLGTFDHFWNYYYQEISGSNNIIQNIGSVPDLSDSLRRRYTAEARFMRAYSYQQLVGLYGDVVWRNTFPQGSGDYYLPRTSGSVVLDSVVNDITKFASDLPVSYPSTDFGRATRGAALALKARILLYQGKWAEAAQAAKTVMDWGVYIIDPNYGSLFDGTNEQSKEIIISAQWTPNDQSAMATWVGGNFVGGWSEITPTQALVDAFECTDGKTIDQSALYDPAHPFDNRDPRLKMIVVVPGVVVNGTTVDVTKPNSPDGLGKNNASFTGYYYKKYVPAVINGWWGGNSDNDIPVLRYPEVLLTYAEAKIEANDIDQSVYDAINAVRSRPQVNQPAITTGKTQAELRTIVRRERRVEFALEEQRLFDIRRWKIAETVMNGQVYGILNYFDNTRSDYGSNIKVETRVFKANRDYLWPIPQSEMDANKFMTQNPNW
ncbi:MAG TPA: RagB/SusD family nutrient uptake outer membrane protein, partial [Bacteroidales bacterium]